MRLSNSRETNPGHVFFRDVVSIHQSLPFVPNHVGISYAKIKGLVPQSAFFNLSHRSISMDKLENLTPSAAFEIVKTAISSNAISLPSKFARVELGWKDGEAEKMAHRDAIYIRTLLTDLVKQEVPLVQK